MSFLFRLFFQAFVVITKEPISKYSLLAWILYSIKNSEHILLKANFVQVSSYLSYISLAILFTFVAIEVGGRIGKWRSVKSKYTHQIWLKNLSCRLAFEIDRKLKQIQFTIVKHVGLIWGTFSILSRAGDNTALILTHI